MRSIFTSFFIVLLASFIAVGVVGPNLGAAFALVAVVTLLTPMIEAPKTPSHAKSWFPSAQLAALGACCIALGAILSATVLLYRDAIDASQFLALAAVLLAVACAFAALTQLLLSVRIAPVIAGALVTLLAIAWLSWPVWLSPWLSNDEWASRLASIHPLIAINAAIPQYGYWFQSPLMYELTSLGQDVNVALPDGVAAAAVFHAAVAGVVFIPRVGWRWRVARRQAA